MSFPYDIREEFGKGRLKVQVFFDRESYEGSLVNMGVRNEGELCYIIGIPKKICQKIGREAGDTVEVVIQPGEEKEVELLHS